MAVMAALPVILAVGSTAMQAISAHNAGEAQKSMATQEANQMRINANNAAGAAERKAQEEDLNTEYTLSAGRAAAAGQSGSASDPSTVNVLSTVAGQGKLRSLNTIYSGLSQEQQMNTQANMTQYGGKLAGQQGNAGAFGAILNGASSMYSKYGSVESNPTTTGGGGGGPLPWQLPLQYQNQAAQNFYG